MLLTQKIRDDLANTAHIDPDRLAGESEMRIKMIDMIVDEAKRNQPTLFKACPVTLQRMRPNAQFEMCIGQTGVTNKLCDKRDACKRYLAPESTGQQFKTFCQSRGSCKHFINIHFEAA